MPIWNPDLDQPHTGESLTLAINNRPREPLQMGARVVPATRGVVGQAVLVDAKDGVIDVVDPRTRGAAPSRTEGGDFKTSSLPILHYPDLVQVFPEEVAGRRAFGSETAYEMPAERLNEKLDSQRRKYELTWEYTLVGASRGKIYDKAGNVVVDLGSAAHLGVGPTPRTIELDDVDLDPVKYFRGLKAQQQALLGAVSVSRWIAYAATDMFEAIVGLPKFVKAWERWQDGAMLRDETDIMVNGVPMGAGVELVHYENITLSNGHTIFPEDEIIFLPVYEGNAQRRFGSAHGMSTTNMIGQPLHATTHDLPHDAGTEVLTQSNVVTWFTRPAGNAIITAA